MRCSCHVQRSLSRLVIIRSVYRSSVQTQARHRYHVPCNHSQYPLRRTSSCDKDIHVRVGEVSVSVPPAIFPRLSSYLAPRVVQSSKGLPCLKQFFPTPCPLCTIYPERNTHIATMSDEKAPLDPPPYTDNPLPVSEKSNGAGASPRGPRPPFPLDLPALNMIRGKRVILASASPRRRQLLAQVSRIAESTKARQPS
jgi:hypothetical protein